MGTRHKRAARCIGCRLHEAHCICNTINPMATRTRLTIIAHRRELKKTTNTGTLAAKTLSNSAVLSWGDEGTTLPPEIVVPAPYRGLILAHDEPPLSVEAVALALGPGPYCLVTPDGSWRQASKMARRIPALAEMPRFSLPPGAPTRYLLRDEPKDGGLATFEAIARALGILEGPAIEEAMMAIFDALVAATLTMRGQGAAT